MRTQTKKLHRTAAIDIAQNDAVTKLMDLVDADNLLMHGCQQVMDCWRDAIDGGIIAEQYNSFEDWLVDYGEAVVNEVILALQDDQAAGELYAMLDEEARDDLMERVLEKLNTSDLSGLAVFFNEA